MKLFHPALLTLFLASVAPTASCAQSLDWFVLEKLSFHEHETIEVELINKSGLDDISWPFQCSDKKATTILQKKIGHLWFTLYDYEPLPPSERCFTSPRSHEWLNSYEKLTYSFSSEYIRSLIKSNFNTTDIKGEYRFVKQVTVHGRYKSYDELVVSHTFEIVKDKTPRYGRIWCCYQP